MIQFVVNVNLLRELDERRLIHSYARLLYNDIPDITEDFKIKSNLESLLDWDINGDKGLGIYCSKFESLKEKDWNLLISIIKEHSQEIKNIASSFAKKRRLNSIKVVNDAIQAKEQRNKEKFSDENYTVSGRGKKARTCVYKGKEYKSRQECIYKEDITKAELYKYLKETNQM